VLSAFAVVSFAMCNCEETEEAIPDQEVVSTRSQYELASRELVLDSVHGETIEAEREDVENKEDASPRLYEPSDFKYLGVLNWNGYRWTWYSQRVLPGGGLSIPGRHVDDDGYVCDENDYICLASGFLDKGTVLDTPLGKKGCVYDYCATANTLDVYVDW